MYHTILRLCFCIFVGAAFIWPGVSLAAPPPGSAVETCMECHEAETNTWLDSPHATTFNDYSQDSGATCEGCHGAYVEDHPEAGVMQLRVDSSTCQECHATTFDQWENSIHAEAGVQCIGCHLSHSQEFRITDDDQCGTCHREAQQDLDHNVHGLADVACIECHAAQAPAPENVTFISTRPQPSVLAPDHDFTQVSEVNCLTCHTDNAHLGLPPTTEKQVDCARKVSQQVESVPALVNRIESMEQTNQLLQFAAPIALGFGLSLGGAIGIIFVLALSCFNRREGDQ